MNAASALSTVEVTGSNLNITYVVLAVALGALGIAFALRQQVLAASDGTAKMREIAEAIKEEQERLARIAAAESDPT